MTPSSPISRYANVLLIVIAAFAIHGHVLDRFWLNDDPQVLLQASRHGPFDVLFDRGAWQELSGSNFTPLVTLSFEADLFLFGLDPFSFYLHQVLAIALAGVALRGLLLELGAGSRSALLLALLFLAAPPTIRVAGQLMTRHYLEGLIAAIASVILWSAAVNGRDGVGRLTAISVLSYFVALLAKEVFILLPLVLLAIGIARMEWRSLVARLIPYAVAMGVYLSWRIWILQGAGGYGPKNIVSHLYSITRAWIASSPTTAIWFLVLVLVVASALRNRADLMRLTLVAVAGLAPLAGVGDAIESRHLLVPATVLLAGAVLGLQHLQAERHRVILSILVFSCVGAGVGTLFEKGGPNARMEAEGRYVWDKGIDSPPLLAVSPGWYLDGLADLDRIWRSESSPRVVYSQTGLVMQPGETRFIAFDDGGSPQVIYPEDTSLRRSYAPSAPIELELHRDGRALQWQFGPNCDCEWRFFSYPGYQMFVVPRHGERIVPRPLEQQWFRIGRYEKSGRWTLSPPLPLPDDGESERWRRAANEPREKSSN